MDQPVEPSRVPSQDEINDWVSDFVEAIRRLFEHLKQTLGIDPQKALGFLSRILEDPESVKRDLVAQVLKGSPDEARKGSEYTTEFVRSPRKAAMPILKEVFPAGTPGRRPQITEHKERELTRMAITLFPAAMALVELRNSPSKRSVKETLGYMEADYPEQTRIFLNNIGVLEHFYSHSQPKNLKARARRLVLQVLAKEFDISAGYAQRWTGAALRKFGKLDTIE